jgi:hypothetical protein
VVIDGMVDGDDLATIFGSRRVSPSTTNKARFNQNPAF